ncbi:hypothetical protein [Paenibacillus validus]|uniref:hypothetical protein n=1 Tax=Paenibacillus validus TaxID=44253 RepID=UPI003D28AF79
MKILHLPIEIAGQMGSLCGALKSYGHEAIGLNYYHTALNYKENIIPADGMEIVNIMGEALRHFDIFHYHHLLTAMTDYRDLEMVAAAGKHAIMHHWGSDVRTAKAQLLNPYLSVGFVPEQETHEKLMTVSKYISTAIVQDYEVLPFVSDYYRQVHILPVAINTSKFIPVFPNPLQSNPLVIHAPSNPKVKGTDVIERTIEMLQREIPFRYQRVDKTSHEQAKQLYRQADIIVDQIITGSYGLLCVESMAFGKPVIAYVRDDLMSRYPTQPPICNASPDTFYDVLKSLLLSPETRFQKGVESRKFTEDYHDSMKVGGRLLEIYGQLTSG